jgi:hypothetical protein
LFSAINDCTFSPISVTPALKLSTFPFAFLKQEEDLSILLVLLNLANEPEVEAIIFYLAVSAKLEAG